MIGNGVASVAGVFGSISHTKLTSLTVGSGLTDVSPFEVCPYLPAITISEANEALASADGVVYSKDMKTLILCPDGKTGEIVIPTGVTSINTSAFEGCKYIKSVTLPKTVASIGDCAFYNCTKLADATVLNEEALFGVEIFANAPASFVMNGYAASTAAEYAQENNLAFELLAPQEEIDLFNLAGANMTLGNDLAMNFYIPNSTLYGDAYYAVITKTYADGTYAVLNIPFSAWVPYSDTLYRVTFSGIAAKEMADTITVQVFNTDGDAVSDIWTDSVKSYIIRNLSKWTGENKTWAVDALNYGAASQTQFFYNTVNLANADLTAADLACGTQSVSIKNNRAVSDTVAGSALTITKNRISFIDVAAGSSYKYLWIMLDTGTSSYTPVRIQLN